MNLKKLRILAGVSAVALTLALGSSPLQAYEMDSGTPIPIPFDTTVLETVTVVTTNLAFGDVAVHQDAVDTADLTISPLGVITQDLAGPARFVSDGNGKAAATVTLTAAFPTTDIYVDYNTPVDLSCGLCVGPPPALKLIKVTDNLNAPIVGTGHTATVLDVLTPANTVEGRGTTSAGGALTWDIGATIRTTPSALYYSTGTYTGSFDMIMSY